MRYRKRRALTLVTVALAAAVMVSASLGLNVGRSNAAVLGCDSQQIRAIAGSFIAAFNHGNSQKLDVLFAQPPAFQWYSSNVPGLRRTETALDRRSLMPYFQARHRRHDRLRLISLTVTGHSQGGEQAIGNFSFKMRRSAADYRRGAWFGLVGKGAVTCSDSSSPRAQLIVLSLGGPGSDKH